MLPQVFNTVPFIKGTPIPQTPAHRYLKIILSHDLAHQRGTEVGFSHFEYFELCVAAHFTTVATFVPTDVDTQIRYRLWHPSLDDETIFQMADLVEEALHWDVKPLSRRWLLSPSGRLLQGHSGEWFSIAAAAYGALRRRSLSRAQRILDLVEAEIENEALVYQEFKEAKDGMGALKACALLAHNLGDLLRVIELWELQDDDPLKKLFQAAYSDKPYSDTLKKAGDLYRDYMAIENHRHFTLRVPRALRRSTDFLLPLCPFLDDWGKKVAAHPDLSLEEVGTIVESLIDGWVRLSGPVGYARALAGIEGAYPGGLNLLAATLPSRNAKTWKTGTLRQLVSVPQSRFEAQWNQNGIKKG